MDILLNMCRGKKLSIPDEYEREISAYLNVREDLKDNKSPDISTLQIYRQQRKKSHELALACRHFSEMVKWHGAPHQSQFLENELINLCLQLQKTKSERMNKQFEEIYYAIAQAEVITWFLALQVEDYAIPFCPSSGRLSVNNICSSISSITEYHRDLFMGTFCWPHGLVVHLQFWSSPDPLGPHRRTLSKKKI